MTLNCKPQPNIPLSLHCSLTIPNSQHPNYSPNTQKDDHDPTEYKSDATTLAPTHTPLTEPTTHPPATTPTQNDMLEAATTNYDTQLHPHTQMAPTKQTPTPPDQTLHFQHHLKLPGSTGGGTLGHATPYKCSPMVNGT